MDQCPASGMAAPSRFARSAARFLLACAAAGTSFLVAGPALASAGPEAEASATGLIGGRVTGEGFVGLAGATVTVYSMNPQGIAEPVQTCSTDAAGDWSVAVSPGMYRVGFTEGSGDFSSCFWPDAGSASEADDVVVPDGGEATCDAVMPLAILPSYHVIAYVRDENGKDLPGIQVKVVGSPTDPILAAGIELGPTGADGRTRSSAAILTHSDWLTWMVFTDPSGAYRTQSLNPGPMVTYYPPYGTTHSYSVSLTPTASPRVTGHVRTTTGAWPPYAEIRFIPVHEPDEPYNETLAISRYGGAFTCDLPPGDYTAWAWAIGDRPCYFGGVSGDPETGTEFTYTADEDLAIDFELRRYPKPVMVVTGKDDLWHDEPVTLSFSLTTDYDWGTSWLLPHFEYNIGNTGYWTTADDVTVDGRAQGGQDGTTRVHYGANDEIGFWEGGFADVKMDTTAPVTTVTGADDAWHNGPALLAFAASDALSGTEGGAARTEYAVDGGPWNTGVSVEVTGDGTHTVAYRSTDNAGNTEAVMSVQLKIDTTAPVTTVTGADDLWHREPVALSFSATDAAGGSGMTGGLAGIEYKVDDGQWRSESAVSVAGDGVHTVLYRSSDAVGNVETPKTVTVRIDAQAPCTLAGGRVTVVRGARATLRYRVDDPSPCSGSAVAGIVVVTGRGRAQRVVWRSGVDTVAVGHWYSRSFRCWLKPGTYRYVVRARDVAGNVQRSPGFGALVVR